MKYTPIKTLVEFIGSVHFSRVPYGVPALKPLKEGLEQSQKRWAQAVQAAQAAAQAAQARLPALRNTAARWSQIPSPKYQV
jgi:hypothetical protein